MTPCWYARHVLPDSVFTCIYSMLANHISLDIIPTFDLPLTLFRSHLLTPGDYLPRCTHSLLITVFSLVACTSYAAVTYMIHHVPSVAICIIQRIGLQYILDI